MRGSDFSGNDGHGFWEDLSVYDTVIATSRFADNAATGIFLEISAKVVVVDNVVARNAGPSIKVHNTSDVRLWNNTVIGLGRAVELVQDGRRNVDPADQAVDDRRPFPDPTMPWTLGPVQVHNNVLSQLPSAAGVDAVTADGGADSARPGPRRGRGPHPAGRCRACRRAAGVHPRPRRLVRTARPTRGRAGRPGRARRRSRSARGRSWTRCSPRRACGPG